MKRFSSAAILRNQNGITFKRAGVESDFVARGDEDGEVWCLAAPSDGGEPDLIAEVNDRRRLRRMAAAPEQAHLWC